MKKYIQPAIKSMAIETAGMIAASGDLKTDVTITDTTIDNVTFGSRHTTQWDDEEE
jgi:hypothetical protein